MSERTEGWTARSSHDRPDSSGEPTDRGVDRSLIATAAAGRTAGQSGGAVVAGGATVVGAAVVGAAVVGAAVVGAAVVGADVAGATVVVGASVVVGIVVVDVVVVVASGSGRLNDGATRPPCSPRARGRRSPTRRPRCPSRPGREHVGQAVAHPHAAVRRRVVGHVLGPVDGDAVVEVPGVLHPAERADVLTVLVPLQAEHTGRRLRLGTDRLRPPAPRGRCRGCRSCTWPSSQNVASVPSGLSSPVEMWVTKIG